MEFRLLTENLFPQNMLSARERGEEAENNKQQHFHLKICFSLNLHPVHKLKKNHPRNKKRIIWVMGRIRVPR